MVARLEGDIRAASAGGYEASQRLTSNDSDKGSLSFIISGTASAAPPVVRRIRLLLRDGAGEGLPFQADPDRPEASVEHEQGTAIIRLDDHILDVRIGLMPIQGRSKLAEEWTMPRLDLRHGDPIADAGLLI